MHIGKSSSSNPNNANLKDKKYTEGLPLISILMPIHNHGEITAECLDSIEKLNYSKNKIEIIISDGATNDATLDLVKSKLENMRKQKFYTTTLLENKTDPGPIACVNQCYRQTDKNSKYILKLDNDVILAPDSLTKGVEAMEKDSKIGIVGGKVFCYDRPDVPALSHCACFFNFFKGRGKCFANDKCTFCDFVSGCYSLIRKKIISPFFLDENFFIYNDDVDFCLRIKNRGYNILYNPGIKIWHRGSATSGAKEWSQFSIYYFTRNRFLLENKHAKFYHKLFFYPYFVFVSAPWFILKIIFTKRVKEIPLRLRAIKDFLLNRQGKQKI